MCSPTPWRPGDWSAAAWESPYEQYLDGWRSKPFRAPGRPDLTREARRNAAEFLRARLRISISEARRRLALAPEVLPQTGITGQHIPARREVLAEALQSAQIPSRSATIISTALDKVRHLTDPDTITGMEQALTRTAVETDPDFVTKMAKRWTDFIDQDGPEPSEETLRQLQGTFIRKPRHGLHHLEIFATAEQFETLSTVMNAATNPRLTDPRLTSTAPRRGCWSANSTRSASRSPASSDCPTRNLSLRRSRRAAPSRNPTTSRSAQRKQDSRNPHNSPSARRLRH